MSKFDALSGRFLVSASAPSAPVDGDMYFNSTTGQWYRYNGTAWMYAQVMTTTSTSTSTSTTTSTTTST